MGVYFSERVDEFRRTYKSPPKRMKAMATSSFPLDHYLTVGTRYAYFLDDLCSQRYLYPKWSSNSQSFCLSFLHPGTVGAGHHAWLGGVGVLGYGDVLVLCRSSLWLFGAVQSTLGARIPIREGSGVTPVTLRGLRDDTVNSLVTVHKPLSLLWLSGKDAHKNGEKALPKRLRWAAQA